jgi:S1-C subfamily serine protease
VAAAALARVKAQFKFLSGARAGEVAVFGKAYIGLGRHPLSDVRFDAERDLDVSSRHAAIMRKSEGFVLQDLGSKNGTFVNGQRVGADVVLNDGDVITCGAHGPAVEFRALVAEGDAAATEAAERAAARASQPREVVAARAPAAPPRPARRSSTGVRVAMEVARQTRQLRRTTKVLFLALLVTAGAFVAVQWRDGQRRSQELGALQARADSLARAAAALLAQFQGRLTSLQDALAQSQAQTARLRRELDDPQRDDATVARLRAELQAAETRQRSLMGAAAVDYRAIAQRNQDAVAIVLVEYSTGERFSGTAFAVDSSGVLVTNRHVLYGEDGTRVPRRLGVMFAGSRQLWAARVLRAADNADLAALKVEIRGGTPRVAGVAAAVPARGDPVAIIGYPLGFDLPMDRVGDTPVADPTLTAGTVSKVLTDVVQIDGYGAAGSSGSPIFDRTGRVVGVLYGGEKQSQGRIVYAVPAARVAALLGAVGVRVP